jgi:eukaryotic translation initiation factor 2C
VLNAFSIQVTNQMIVVPGHELLAPSVMYGKGQLCVADSSWNILDVRFHQGGHMTNWKVLCT